VFTTTGMAVHSHRASGATATFQQRGGVTGLVTAMATAVHHPIFPKIGSSEGGTALVTAMGVAVHHLFF